MHLLWSKISSLVSCAVDGSFHCRVLRSLPLFPSTMVNLQNDQLFAGLVCCSVMGNWLPIMFVRSETCFWGLLTPSSFWTCLSSLYTLSTVCTQHSAWRRQKLRMSFVASSKFHESLIFGQLYTAPCIAEVDCFIPAFDNTIWRVWLSLLCSSAVLTVSWQWWCSQRCIFRTARRFVPSVQHCCLGQCTAVRAKMWEIGAFVNMNYYVP